MCQYVLTPILDRYGVPENERVYRMTFSIQGLMAIITQWLKQDCTDPIDHIIAIMQKCILPRQEEV